MAKKSLSGDLLNIRYVNVRTVQKWNGNPKLHDIGALAESIKKHGFRGAPIYDNTMQSIVAGNGRIEAVLWLQRTSDEPPPGIATDEDGNWYIPVQFGVDAGDVDSARSFGVDHNNLTLLGGDLTLFDIAKIWEDSTYEELLADLAEVDNLPVTIDPDDVDALLNPAFLDDLMPLDDAGVQASHTGYSFRVYVNSREDLMEAIAAIRELIEENPEWQARIV